MKLWTVLLAGVLAFGALGDADAARRLGGGGSVGRQSSNVTQRQNAPDAPAAPTNAQRPSQAQPAGAAAAQPARRPWGAMLGGLAAGLGLAWLANSLGLGAAFGNILLFGLLALVIMVVIGAIMRRRAGAAAAQRPGQGYAYQAAGASAEAPVSPRQYNPEKVGNDASARPWERNTTNFDAGRAATGGVRIGSGLQSGASALEGPQSWGVPAGFDTDSFLAAAKRNFVTLQDAWDRGDLKSLRGMMTDEMMREMSNQIAERDRQPQAGAQKTEVVMLEAQLLGIEDSGADYLASVEFSGIIREEPSAGPSPFREVWNMSKPRDGSAGWLVAGVQALQ
ncbi:MAG TPA: TIM44-like domain-containing protein [Ramlibacter sp.]|jgi:predicted lipid-binding transport protein (Tim44 family)